MESTRQNDLERLLDHVLDFAHKTLSNHGEFYPFGAVVRTDGELRYVAGYSGSETPPSQQVIDLIVAGTREGARTKEIRAVGICYDARVRPPDSEPTDAIAVALEHVEGEPALALMPYKKVGTEIEYSELTIEPGERRVFV